MDFSSLVPEAAGIAADAGNAVLQFWEPRGRNDGDRADRTAHRVITAALAALRPKLNIVSEEGHLPDIGERGRWERFWLVDPIDSTGSFRGGYQDFTVNIALMEQGRPILGVVHHPVSGDTYHGARGCDAGCINVKTGASRSIRVRTSCEGVARVVSPRHDDERRRERFLASLTSAGVTCEDTRRSSSIRFCLVAEGTADVYPGLLPLSEWDTAAGVAVLECAGGRVIETATGDDLRYNRPDLRTQPEFVAYGPTDIRWLDHLS